MDTDPTTPLAAEAPLPRMTDADIAAARDRIAAYVADSAAAGITLRPITGQVIRLAAGAGIDLERLGGDIDEIPDEEYYDQIVRVGWLLSAPLPDVVAVCQAGSATALAREASLWALETAGTVEQEGALMRAFIARWLEYRVEMQILRQHADS